MRGDYSRDKERIIHRAQPGYLNLGVSPQLEQWRTGVMVLKEQEMAFPLLLVSTPELQHSTTPCGQSRLPAMKNTIIFPPPAG
jgi:hypothetical protein